MGLFGKKKDRIIDLGERYKIPEKKTEVSKSDDSSNLGFLGNLASGSDSSSNYSDDGEEKKKKLVKRLLEMTNKIEDLSNQVYHLKQRIELLEKKLKVSFE